MSSRRAIVSSALAGVMGLTLMGASGTVLAQDKPEKCYGVTKAGQNDCQTANSACAGTSKTDGQKDAWVYVPKGTCEKLVGGSLSPA